MCRKDKLRSLVSIFKFIFPPAEDRTQGRVRGRSVLWPLNYTPSPSQHSQLVFSANIADSLFASRLEAFGSGLGLSVPSDYTLVFYEELWDWCPKCVVHRSFRGKAHGHQAKAVTRQRRWQGGFLPHPESLSARGSPQVPSVPRCQHAALLEDSWASSSSPRDAQKAMTMEKC